jgi:hypothetical protein
MASFLQIVASERLKLFKSAIWLLIPISPLLAGIIGIFVSFDNVQPAERYPVLLGAMSIFHALMLLPLLTGILSAFVCRYEHGGGGWKQLLTLPVSRTGLYAAKLLIVALSLAATQLLFLAAIIAVAAYHGIASDIPWRMLLAAVGGGWLACLPLAALQLSVSTLWSSFAAPLVINVMLTLPNLLIINSKQFAPYYPWAQPALAMVHSISTEFGAFALPLNSLLITVLGSFAVFLAAGLIYFNRKEL